MFKVANAKVLVLTPPPVEAGEAPIHIKKMTNNNDGTVMSAKSITLKPAVLGVTALKAAFVIFPKTVLCSNKVLLYSEINKNIQPPIKSDIVVYTTILVLSVMIFICLWIKLLSKNSKI